MKKIIFKSFLKFERLINFFEISNKKISNVKRVSVGERVRDINIKDNKLYLFLEDTASIGTISLN